MQTRCLKSFAVSVLAVSLFSVSPSPAQTFSTSPGSVSGAMGDIYSPGPPPFLPGDPLMLNVNALSLGRGIFEFNPAYALEFSVAAGSFGIPSAVPGFNMVFEEATGMVGGLPVGTGGDEAADIFMETGAGGNILNADGDGVANPNTPALGAFGLVEPATLPGDDLDAWDNRPLIALGTPAFLFSLDPVGAATFGVGATAADIILWPGLVAAHDTPPGLGGTSGIYGAGATMGLLAGDDIDGLIYFDGGATGVWDPADIVLFSLAPGSPTLGALGASPADVLITAPGAAPMLHRSAGAMGLAATDDIDALDITQQMIIPEPGSIALLVLGLASAFALRRRAS